MIKQNNLKYCFLIPYGLNFIGKSLGILVFVQFPLWENECKNGEIGG